MTQTITHTSTCRGFWIGRTARFGTARGYVNASLSPSLRPSPGRFGMTQCQTEQAVNLVQNPRFGNGDIGFLKNWGTEQSFSVTEEDGPLGQQRFLRVVTSVNHAGEGCVYGPGGQIGVAGGTPQTASMYVRGTGTVRARISFNVGGGGASGPVHTLTGAWERITVTATPTDNTSALAIVETTSAQVATIESGAWQFEASPHATTYLDGSMGAGFFWLGTPDQSASQRQAGRISLPAQIASLVRGGVALWWRPDHSHDSTRDRVLLHVPTTGTPLQLRHIVVTNRFRLSSPAGDTVEVDAPSFAAGDDLLVSAGWTHEALTVGVGETTARAERSTGPWVAAGRIDLGSTGEAPPSSGLHANGALGPAWWFDAPPTAEVLRVLGRSVTLPRLSAD